MQTVFHRLNKLQRTFRCPDIFQVQHQIRNFAESNIDKQEFFRILSPTAILGYGFPEKSFQKALNETSFDLIGVDAGSIDPGPFYLASKSSFTSLEHVKRDLRLIIKGLRKCKPGCKLVIGSVGGCGTNNQLFILADALQEMLREEGMTGKSFATITRNLSQTKLAKSKKYKFVLGFY